MFEIRTYPNREAAANENCVCFVDAAFKTSALKKAASGKCETWARAYSDAVTKALRGAKLTASETMERRAGLLAESIRAYFPEGGRFGFAAPTSQADVAMLRRANDMLTTKATAVVAGGLLA